MSVNSRDTIAAIATPIGVGGIGIVRISGPRAGEIAASLLRRPAGAFPDRQLVRGVVRDCDGARVDDVLAVVMRAPRTLTGEEVAEIHGHGGSVNMARILRAVLTAGARPAEPGEFSRRAFENGKLDLAQAEALLAVIEAGSERAWRAAQAQLAGGLGSRVRALRGHVTDLLASIEASIDFPEEGLEFASAREWKAEAAALGEKIDALVATFAAGRALREGVEVALVGPVNAGKSSLFNALLGVERAVVAPEPGTTRDFLECRVVWEGLPVTLIDTAGERLEVAQSAIERRAVELGQTRAQQVDLRVVVDEASAVLTAVGCEENRRELQVASKGDLLSQPYQGPRLLTSAKTGQGLEELRRAIVARALGEVTEGDDGLVVTSERQRTLLERASRALRRVATAPEHVAASPELLAMDARESSEALAEIVGERVGEEVLDAVFARFCIGK